MVQHVQMLALTSTASAAWRAAIALTRTGVAMAAKGFKLTQRCPASLRCREVQLLREHSWRLHSRGRDHAAHSQA